MLAAAFNWLMGYDTHVSLNPIDPPIKKEVANPTQQQPADQQPETEINFEELKDNLVNVVVKPPENKPTVISHDQKESICDEQKKQLTKQEDLQKKLADRKAFLKNMRNNLHHFSKEKNMTAPSLFSLKPKVVDAINKQQLHAFQQPSSRKFRRQS